MFRLLLLGFVLFFTSCAFQSDNISTIVKQESYHRLYIPLPDNHLVFENMGPILYDEMIRHIGRIGFDITKSANNAYVLRLSILSLSPIKKLISPDILLFNVIVRIKIKAQLFDDSDKLVKEHTFSFSRLICKPRNPIINSSVHDFEYRNLMRMVAPAIEHYFRLALKK